MTHSATKGEKIHFESVRMRMGRKKIERIPTKVQRWIQECERERGRGDRELADSKGRDTRE
jgi:hypothetical protein